MRILFCSHNPLDLKLGAPKVIMEVASAMEKLGWNCVLASDTEICPDINSYQGMTRIRRFTAALGAYLEKNAASYDVVDYDHLYLPFARERFTKATLFVARSVLLEQHFEKIPLPRYRGLRSLLGHLVKGPQRYAQLKYRVAAADRAMNQADLINVSNDHDKAELVSRGHNPEKIVVVPFGLSAARFEQFRRAALSPSSLDTPRVAFIGTFDNRKGGVEFPRLVAETVSLVPNVKFKLLGASYRTREQVEAFFPASLRSHLEVITRFDPDELPALLRDTSIGVFPSHIEGFGFGVLEMLAAGVPVIAYDAPGPPMMLPQEFLAPRGDSAELARKAAALLTDEARLRSARDWAVKRAADFTWERFGQVTGRAYEERLKALR